MLNQNKNFAAALGALLGAGLLVNGLEGKLPVLARSFPVACVMLPALAAFALYAAGQRTMKAVVLILLALWLCGPFYFPLLGKEEFRQPDSFVVRCESGVALHGIILRGEERLALARAARAGGLKARVFVRPPAGDSKIRLRLNSLPLKPPRPAMSDAPAEAFEEKDGAVTLELEIENAEGKFVHRPIPPSDDVISFCENDAGEPTPMTDKRLMVELRFYDERNRIRRIFY